MRKKHQAHENHERWLVSYADFITLLFAFFVVMFAVSQVDSQKLGRFVESVNVAFAVNGPFPESSQFPIPSEVAGNGIIVSPDIAPPKFIPPADDLPSHREQLEESIRALLLGSKLADRVKIRMDVRGIVVSLSEAGFFDVGSDVVRPDSLETLRALGEILREEGSPIAVEGHTDNTPIRTTLFRSNWELATARATTIVHYLIDELRFDATRLSATGFAEFRPMGDNSTAEGRATNRRVDLVILTERSEGPPPSLPRT